MGKKRKQVPGLQEALEKPWCYYCEREFNDLLNLSRHQKAKHFKCGRCGRRLNTAGGLSVHMQQVHKETLQKVENALDHRQGLDVEIFGMEGIPQDLVDQRKQRVIREFEAAADAKRQLTGNPLPGMPVKRRESITEETHEEIMIRFRAWTKDKAEGKITVAPAQSSNSFSQPSFGQYPAGQFQNQASYAPPLHSGKRRGSTSGDGPPSKRADNELASAVDEFIADARKAAPTSMETSKPTISKAKTGKEKKKRDNTEVLWKYEHVSPEEVRSTNVKYLFTPKAYSVELH